MKKRELLSRIIPLFSGYKKSLFLAVFLVISATICSSLIPLIFRRLLDQAIPSQDLRQIMMIAGTFFLLTLLAHAFSFCQQLLVGSMGFEIVNRLKVTVYRHILTLPLRYFEEHGVGRLVSRVDSDAQQLFMLFSSVALELVWALINLIFAYVVMFTVSVKFTLMILPIMPLFLLISITVFSRLRTRYIEDRKLYNNISAHLTEQLRSIPLLRGLNAIAWSKEKISKSNREKVSYGAGISIRENITFFSLKAMPELAIALLLYHGASGVHQGALTVGTIWMFIDYLRRAMDPLFRVSEQIGQLQRGFSSAERLFEILEKQGEYQNLGPITRLPFADRIDFVDVNFAHTPDRPTLKNLSLSIKKGEVVAVVGPTGSGKTTLFNLLSGFYSIEQGKILIDGKEIRREDLRSWRGNLGHVWQEIKLFPGNVLDNLRVLRQDISDETVLDSIEKLQLHPLISRFKDGIHTQLLENGNGISQGEKQLLSIARSIVFNPDILLLDEATSSIDPHTEKMIQAALGKAMNGKTALIIAHRLSTITQADRIVVLSQGEIVETGNHHELLELDGTYASLYRAQFAHTQAEEEKWQ